MDRRRERKASKGAPAWMTTFGDLMALLLTFFVLMLSLSNINQQKYEAISEALGDSFGNLRLKLPDTQAPPGQDASVIESPIKLNGTPFRKERQLDDVINERFENEIKSGLLGMKVRDGEMTMSFPDHLAFAPGSAKLKGEFVQMLNRLSLILSDVPGAISVSGHTDNRPVKNNEFNSNWALSSARAVAVVEALIDTGRISPTRLSASAYAGTRPLAANENEELRARNRRVEISLIQEQK